MKLHIELEKYKKPTTVEIEEKGCEGIWNGYNFWNEVQRRRKKKDGKRNEEIKPLLGDTNENTKTVKKIWYKDNRPRSLQHVFHMFFCNVVASYHCIMENIWNLLLSF